MKDRRRLIIVFSVFWIIGLLGGYYLGVGSALLPAETVEYNYYFAEKSAHSDVEPINKKCSNTNDEDDEGHDGSFVATLIEKAGLDNLSDKIVDWVSPQ
jgi:hypothetical protein